MAIKNTDLVLKKDEKVFVEFLCDVVMSMSHKERNYKKGDKVYIYKHLQKNVTSVEALEKASQNQTDLDKEGKKIPKKFINILSNS